MQKKVKVVVYGIGNPGRRDDGLGPRLVSRLRDDGNSGVDFEIRDHLNIEDALTIKDSEVVVFADAAKDIDTAWKLFPIRPSKTITFTTHEMAPESVLALCQDLYGLAPEAFVLAIKGYNWDMEESLSEEAAKNLSQAVEALKGFLRTRA